MLFNTLSYAAFFGTVWVVSWILVERRWAPALPWLALAAYALLGSRTPLSAGVVISAGLATLGLCRPRGDARPSLPTAAAAVGLNLAVGTWLTWRVAQRDPLGFALSGLHLPVPRGPLAFTLGLALAAVLGVLLVRAARPRLAVILGASYVFYAFPATTVDGIVDNWKFLPLVFASSTVDWWLGRRIGREQDQARRKRWLIVTVVVNLGLLAFFKYTNFCVDSLRTALGAVGVSVPVATLQVALPIGISFFTFESMSYVIDVYRRDLPPHESYLEYLSFVAFFPHLVSGPIVRPRDLLPQLGGAPRFSERDASEGLFLIAVGLLKKVAIADYLALNLVDRVFDQPIQYSALECYVAVLGYATQIYCDFSGYTDVAIGSALLLGVRMPKNFDAPYKAHDIQNFWRRWHISLSTWLRDYLYVPLGGNRLGRARTYLNLLATMVLGGLWHGASWTFVVWGGLHGLALAADRWWSERRGGRAEPAGARRVLGVLATFHFVCLCWVFFRSRTFGQAWILFSEIATATTQHANLSWQVLGVLGLGLGTHWLPERWFERALARFSALPAVAQGAVLVVVGVVLRRVAGAEQVPFVYFQF